MAETREKGLGNCAADPDYLEKKGIEHGMSLQMCKELGLFARVVCGPPTRYENLLHAEISYTCSAMLEAPRAAGVAAPGLLRVLSIQGLLRRGKQ